MKGLIVTTVGGGALQYYTASYFCQRCHRNGSRWFLNWFCAALRPWTRRQQVVCPTRTQTVLDLWTAGACLTRLTIFARICRSSSQKLPGTVCLWRQHQETEDLNIQIEIWCVVKGECFFVVLLILFYFFHSVQSTVGQTQKIKTSLSRTIKLCKSQLRLVLTTGRSPKQDCPPVGHSLRCVFSWPMMVFDFRLGSVRHWTEALFPPAQMEVSPNAGG